MTTHTMPAPIPGEPSATASAQTSRSIIPVHLAWMIRADMEDVLEIEAYSKQDHPWNQDTFQSILRDRSAIGMVARQYDPTAPVPPADSPRGKVLGFCIYLLEKQSLHVLNLSVHCDYRFFGIGRQIVEKLKAKLSLQKRRQVTIPVPERNLGMQLFLKQCGFRARGVLDHPPQFPNEVRYHFEYRLHADSDCTGTGSTPNAQKDRQ